MKLNVGKIVDSVRKCEIVSNKRGAVLETVLKWGLVLAAFYVLWSQVIQPKLGAAGKRQADLLDTANSTGSSIINSQ